MNPLAGLALRVVVALSALGAVVLLWRALKPLLLHLFSVRIEWLQAQPLSALLLLGLLYGALLACLMTMFSLFPDRLLAETRAGLVAVSLVILPAWLATGLRLVIDAAGLPPGYAETVPLAPVLLLTVSMMGHWWRMHHPVAPA